MLNFFSGAEVVETGFYYVAVGLAVLELYCVDQAGIWIHKTFLKIFLFNVYECFVYMDVLDPLKSLINCHEGFRNWTHMSFATIANVLSL